MADHPAGNIARAVAAAGALFFDEDDQVMLVRPTYKDHWDIPGGYLEPGETPTQACEREVREELGITMQIGSLLVVDWAPTPKEGDKILFVFDGGMLSPAQHKDIRLQDKELAEYRYVNMSALREFTNERLTRRITAALEARNAHRPAYLEPLVDRE